MNVEAAQPYPRTLEVKVKVAEPPARLVVKCHGASVVADRGATGATLILDVAPGFRRSLVQLLLLLLVAPRPGSFRGTLGQLMLSTRVTHHSL